MNLNAYATWITNDIVKKSETKSESGKSRTHVVVMDDVQGEIGREQITSTYDQFRELESINATNGRKGRKYVTFCPTLKIERLRHDIKKHRIARNDQVFHFPQILLDHKLGLRHKFWPKDH